MSVDSSNLFWVRTRTILISLSLTVLVSGFALPARSQQAPPVAGVDGVHELSEEQASASNQQPDQQAQGSISGKVVDQSGAAIGGARVSLSRGDQSASQEILTDNDGQFSFANVVPGPFHLTIASQDLTPQTFDDTLSPGQAYSFPLVMLTIAAQVTEVRVGVTPAELAQDQVHQEEKQRVFGLIPNFFVTYDPHPAPLPAKLKFRLAWKSSVDPFTLLAVGAVAGAEQAGNQWRGYGQGAQGYAKRYGASYADVAGGTFIGGAILPSLLKQDPRYFYQGTGSKKSRILHALASSVMCRGDNGKMEPNYSNIGGAFAAGGLATLYAPPGSRTGARLVVSTALIRIGETAVAGVFQELFIRKATPSARRSISAQP
jgi:Carboxypeptidase regulatory-like domain